jgi:hypothetical protein
MCIGNGYVYAMYEGMWLPDGGYAMYGAVPYCAAHVGGFGKAIEEMVWRLYQECAARRMCLALLSRQTKTKQ